MFLITQTKDFIHIIQVDEKTRASMFKLRQTWTQIFPNQKLYALDLRVQQIDPAWPITATPPEKGIGSIHVNPKFLKQVTVKIKLTRVVKLIVSNLFLFYHGFNT